MIVSKRYGCCYGHRPKYGDVGTDIFGLATTFTNMVGNVLGGNAAKTSQAQSAAQIESARAAAQASEERSKTLRTVAIAGAAGIAVLGGVIAFTKRAR